MARKLEISGLSKWFDELEALRGIDVAVETRRVHRGRRPERLRQDHIPAHRRGA